MPRSSFNALDASLEMVWLLASWEFEQFDGTFYIHPQPQPDVELGPSKAPQHAVPTLSKFLLQCGASTPSSHKPSGIGLHNELRNIRWGSVGFLYHIRRGEFDADTEVVLERMSADDGM